MNAVGRLLLGRGAVDHDFVVAHTEGFGTYRDFLLRADWEGLVPAAGVPEAPISVAAALVCGDERRPLPARAPASDRA
jgi:anaerobic selenocysteine-containing dehydrogenase